MTNENRPFSLFLQFNLFITAITAITQSHYGTYKQSPTISTTNNAFVVFDPNVSILDMHNRFRYTVTDQIPLVRQAATKFTKLFILVSEIDLKEGLQTSLSQSPMAIAEYNKLRSSSEKKLEVWLAYSGMARDHRYDDDFLYHKEPHKTINILNSIAQQSNAIFNGTVTTILLPFKLMYNHINELVSENGSLDHQFWSVDKWGILFETDILYRYKHGEFRESVSKLAPNVVIITLLPFIEIPQLVNDINSTALSVKKAANLGNDTKFGFFIRAADTDVSGKVNMSKLISTWHLANDWSESTNHTVILSKAFDTPYGDTTEQKTDGWWRLLEHSGYNTSENFRFEEKALSVLENDLRNESSFTLLKEKISFSKDYVEVIFSMFDYTRAKNSQRYSKIEIDILLKKLVASFEKVWMVFHDDTGLGTDAFIYELECLKLIREKVEVSVVILPNISLTKVFKWNVTLDYVESEAPNYFPLLNTIKTYVAPFSESGGDFFYFKNIYLNGRDTSLYKLGYMFNIISCSSYLARSHQQDFETMQHHLKVNNVTVIIFYFEEDEPTVKLGAARMFQQRAVTMEQCRKLVEKWDLSPELTLKFMLLHYPTSAKFYMSKWEMANYIEYWHKLSEWGKEMNTSVILSNVIDTQRYSPKLAARYQLREPYISELGWWRLQSGSEDVNENKMWINKIDDALIQFPDNNKSLQPSIYFSPVQIILIVFFSMAVVLIVVVCVVKRNEREETLLSKSEIDEFYNGMRVGRLVWKKVSCSYNLPYEKNRHEINTEAFKVDFESKIGSGEFGMVCLARIQMQKETVQVAVKTVNPAKVNKVSLKGFLSEIKVLAYIGKHEHITQMIGANTQDLKNGKVYIFLEYCELGSLKKYLGKIRVSLESEDRGSVKQEATWDDRTTKYLELISRTKDTSMDSFVSEDLLRWSHEICKGMAYLASKHVVHADLATRNVLLSACKTAKICDFGLSRRMYNYTNYVKQQQEPLPWKWMAPESFKRSEFSEKSDVWAYGMTMWEIFSLGDQPYPGLTWTFNFANMLEEGLRMDEPKYDNVNMYWMMKECWSTKPQNRPSFAELLALYDG